MKDKWFPTPTTYKVISPLQLFDDFPMVSALIDEETKRWKVDIVKSLFLPFEVETILNIPLNYNLPEDKIIWVGNKKGEFTVKSAYYIALIMIKSPGGKQCSHEGPKTPLWKKIWHLKIPPKIRIFTYLFIYIKYLFIVFAYYIYLCYCLFLDLCIVPFTLS